MRTCFLTAATAILIALIGPGATFASELFKRRCMMGSCSWFKVEERTPIGADAHGELFEAILKYWWSVHDAFSSLDYDRPVAREGGAYLRSYYYCSKTKPTVLWEDEDGKFEAVILDVYRAGGAGQRITSEYYAVCHDVQFIYDRSLQTDYGYVEPKPRATRYIDDLLLDDVTDILE